MKNVSCVLLFFCLLLFTLAITMVSVSCTQKTKREYTLGWLDSGTKHYNTKNGFYLIKEEVFQPDNETPLCDIMFKEGSDKGGPGKWHNYTTYYHKLFVSNKNKVLRIFELGLGTNYTDVKSNMGANGVPGASLRGWAKFFPHSNVYGADIDRRVLFSEDRIKTYYCDQTDPTAISKMWDTDELRDGFDVIVEDGVHTFEASACFMVNSLHKLRTKGVFIVEDVDVKYLDKLIAFAAGVISQNKKYSAKLVRIPHPTNKADNNLLVVTRES
jgi:hypothetical protein